MIEAAYERLGMKLADVLVASSFISATTDLQIDPPAPFTPTGDERQLIRAASLVTVRTQSVRQIIGRPVPRHVVERECRLEMGLAGPNRGLRLQIEADTLARVAALPNLDPTLGGLAERLLLNDQTDDELPPNGISVFINFTIRVRSGDPLGRTP